MRRALRALHLVLATSFRVSRRRAAFSFLEAGGALLEGVRPLFVAWLVGAVAVRNGQQFALAVLGFVASIAVEQLLNQIGINARIKQLERVGGEFDFEVARLTGEVQTLQHMQSPEYLDQLQTLRDQEGILGVALNKLLNGITGGVRFLAVIALVVWTDWRLVLVGAAAVPSVLATLQYARWRGAAEDEAAAPGRLAAHLLRLALDAEAAAETRIFRLESFLRRSLRRTTLAWRAPHVRQAGKQAAVEAACGVFFFAAAAAVIAVILGDVLAGRAPVPALVVALIVVTRLQAAVLGILDAIGGVSSVIRTAGRFMWLADYKSGADDLLGDADVGSLAVGDIHCESVGYRYPGAGRPVLRDISLRLEPGTVVAVVGENGAGKSTLVNLLTGMYLPTMGRVNIGGRDLRSWSLPQVRARMAGAFQDFARFELSALASVGVGDLPRHDDEAAVVRAVREAGAERLIDALPDGLRTQLGSTWSDGVGLSGGQWQRLALARGLMRAAPGLLVLDEPTSALDALAEDELFRRYAAAASSGRQDGRTTLLVTHRFSAVRSADRILVLHEGRLAEDGTHAELVQAGGIYAQLYELQVAGYR